MAAFSDCAEIMAPVIQENQLVLPESTDGLTLGDYIPVLEQYREINKAIVFDYRDKKGNAAARSHVAKLRRVKAPINDIHKRLKADYKAIVEKMDADKREALAVVEEMIEHHDHHLRAVEAEEKAEAERKRIREEVAAVWDLAHEMNTVFDRQRELDRQAAEQARIAKAQEDEQRRIEQQKREKEIADQAAENARKLAEAEKRETEEKEKALVEQARKDLENIRRVHWLIIPELMKVYGLSEDQAKGVILAIRDGSIPAVSIDYRWER
jgi:hypothetical protein